MESRKFQITYDVFNHITARTETHTVEQSMQCEDTDDGLQVYCDGLKVEGRTNVILPDAFISLFDHRTGLRLQIGKAEGNYVRRAALIGSKDNHSWNYGQIHWYEDY